MRTGIPNLATGYARSPSESAFPELWKGLLCAHLPVLGPQGFTLQDFSGYCRGATMTNMNNDDWVVGQDGFAVDLDGSNDYVLGTFSQATGTDLVSYVIRFKTASTANQLAGLVCQRNGTTFEQFDVGIAATTAFNTPGAKLIAVDNNGITGSRAALSATSVTDALWHHCVVVRGVSTNTIWLDGKLDATTNSVTLATIADGVPVMIGQIGNSGAPVAGYYFAGMISEVLIYNRPLTPGEISLLYQMPGAPFVLRERRLSGTTAQDFTLSISDSITMAEARTSAPAVNKSDALTVDDTRTSASGLNKSDSIVMSDALIQAIAKALADNVTVADAKTLSVTKAISDTFGVSDALAQSITKAITDAIVVSDMVLVADMALLTDSFTVADLIQLAASKIISDSLIVADTATELLARNLAISDALILGDSLLASLLKVKPGGLASFQSPPDRNADYVEITHGATSVNPSRTSETIVAPAHSSTYQKPNRRVAKY